MQERMLLSGISNNHMANKKRFKLEGEGEYNRPDLGAVLKGDFWEWIIEGTTSQTVQSTKNKYGKELKVVELE